LLNADRLIQIGAVIEGSHPGRTANGEITLFDGTGIALQDLAVASLAVEMAVQKGIATEIA
jgi:ornithine cyclodeaminase